MSDPDYSYEYDEEDKSWYVYNMTKWGRKDLAVFSGPDALAWARKYYSWLNAREQPSLQELLRAAEEKGYNQGMAEAKKEYS